MEVIACREIRVERVMTHVSLPVPVAEMQIAAGKTVFDGLERCLAL